MSATSTPGPRGLPGLVPFYVSVFPLLIPVAKEHGYALAVHGSVARDLDVVAIPWTPEASDAITLIKALKVATGTFTHGPDWDDLSPDCEPHPKPHGRVAYSLHFTGQGCHGPYIDVSVMPLAV